MPAKRSATFTIAAATLWAGCAATAPTQAPAGAAASSTPAARFAARQPLQARQADTDEYGAPLNLRAAVLSDGACYRVVERPGRLVCIGGEVLDFQTTSPGWGGPSYTRAVFVGGADEMTLYQASEGMKQGDRYEGWVFEDDAAHVVTPTPPAAPVDEPEVPEWFLDARAPALRIERTGGARDAVMTCGRERLRLSPLTGAEQRALLGATPFSAPPVQPRVTLAQTESGVTVAVATATDHLGRDHVLIEVGGVEVDVIASSEVRATPRAEVFHGHRGADSYAIVGGAEVRVYMGGLSYRPGPRSRYQRGEPVPDAVAAPIHERLKATMTSRMPAQPAHEPTAGPCTELASQ